MAGTAAPAPPDDERLHRYADWIRNNQDKQGSPEWVKVTEAYRNLRTGAPPVVDINDVGSGDAGKGWYDRFTSGIESITPGPGAAGRMATSALSWPWDLPAMILNKDRELQSRLSPPTQPGDPGTREWREKYRQDRNLPNPRPELEPPPTWAPTSGSVWTPEAPPQIPYLAPNLRKVLGVPELPEDASLAQRVAESVGSSILGGPKPTAGMTRAATAAAPSFTQRVAPVVSELAAALGSEVGADVGRGIGGEGGATVGSILGALTPHGVSRLANPVTRSFLAKPGEGSQRMVETLDAQGIPVSPGLVGNRGAATMENTVAGLPWVGVFPANRQAQQFRAFNEATFGTAGDVAGFEFANRQVPGAGATGGVMREAAGEALQNINQRTGRQYDEFFQQPGVSDVNVVPNEVRQSADELIRGGSARTERDVRETLDQDIYPIARSPYDPATVPTGPASTIPAAGTSNVPLPPDAPTSIPLEKYRNTRSEIGKDTQGQKTLATREAGTLYEGITRDIEREIMEHPAMVRAFPDAADRLAQVERMRVLDSEYRTLNRDTGSRYEGRDVPTLNRFEKIGNNKDVFTFGSEPDVMSVMNRNADPAAANRIAGETLLNKTANSSPIEGVSISPLTLSSWWGNLGEQQKLAMVNGNMRAYQNMDQLAEVGEAFRARHGTSNVSKTAPTLATMGAVTSLATQPLRTLAVGTGIAGLGSAAASEPLARYLGRTDPQWAELLRRRGVNAAIMADEPQ